MRIPQDIFEQFNKKYFKRDNQYFKLSELNLAFRYLAIYPLGGGHQTKIKLDDYFFNKMREGEYVFTDEIPQLMEAGKFGFVGAPVQLPDADVVDIDVAVIAEGIEIRPHWTQTVRFFRGRDSGLLEFTFIPRAHGRRHLLVEFYYQRHWLSQVELTIEVVEAQPHVTG